MDRKEIARIIGEACGSVSLCWNPRPTGEFDSETASKFVDEAVAQICGDNESEKLRQRLKDLETPL